MLPALIEAATEYAVSQGARIVEVYPLVAEESRNVRMSSYMGMLSTFERLGFKEVARPSKTRAVVRYTLPGPDDA